MITIRDRVEALVSQSPHLRDSLAEGLINVSSLARRLHPQIQSDLRKDVTVDAVFMALNRYASSLESQQQSKSTTAIGELSIRTQLFQRTIQVSDRLLLTLTAALNQIRPKSSSFFVFTQGLHEMTLTASNTLLDEIDPWLENERVVSRRDNLTALSIQRPNDSGEQPLALENPLRLLSWNGIEIVDIVSTTNELIILLNDTDVDRAFSALRSVQQASTDKTKKRAS